MGCSGVITSEKYALLNATCQTAEVTTSWQGKTLPTACEDIKGNFHLVATGGRPSIATVEALITGAVVGGAIYGASLNIDTGTDLSFDIPGQ